MTELIQMPVKALATILVLTLLMPTAAAHGANTFSFIMRNELIQPETAQVIQNDTPIFYNTPAHNRTVLIDIDGDGLDDVDCEAGPSDSSSTEDECWVWLDPSIWGGGVYEAKLMENGTLWHTVEFTIVLDNHTETPPPAGFLLGPAPSAANEDGAGLRAGVLPAQLTHTDLQAS